MFRIWTDPGLAKATLTGRRGPALLLPRFPAFHLVQETLVQGDTIPDGRQVCIDPFVRHAGLFVVGTDLIGIGQLILQFLHLFANELDRAIDAAAMLDRFINWL